MQHLEQKFAKVRNSRTKQDRLVAMNGSGVLHLLQDEYVVPFSIKDKWMMEKVANLIKARELMAIRAKLENMDEWAMMITQAIPDFYLGEIGQGRHPNGMTSEEIAKFRIANQDAISFYGVAIQYLERGHSPEEVQKFMEERHPHAGGRDGVKVAFADHSANHKELLDLVEGPAFTKNQGN